mmetsp:Transcript_7725/g.28487  ORF Transcript_7725/g.28487 Transcript_7725/m.28487 type:complete len:1174 (-) Transcript_7725:136-3657(-)
MELRAMEAPEDSLLVPLLEGGQSPPNHPARRLHTSLATALPAIVRATWQKVAHRLGAEDVVENANVDTHIGLRERCAMFFGKKKEEKEFREIQLNDPDVGDHFINNKVKTSRYTLLTFLPKNLFEQLRKAVNVYFLIVAGLSWWEEVSPYDPLGTTIAIIFIITISAVKDAVEDMKRHKEDMLLNETLMASVMQPDGSFEVKQWQHVRVGDFVKVEDEEAIPADIVLLYSSNPGKNCFIKTTSLDGETNLKSRSVVGGLGVHDPEDVLKLEGLISCEHPNTSLIRFQGKLDVSSDLSTSGSNTESSASTLTATVRPLSITEMLLRGCVLKNTGFVIGVVVYTGQESRIMMNASAPPSKRSHFEKFVNRQLIIVAFFQALITFGSAAGALIWRNNNENAWYLREDENGDSDFVFFVKISITFFILYSYLVSISLIVSLEVGKFIQAYAFIDRDIEMYYEDTDEPTCARTSSLNEDLGLVSYIFSDKTGTLTQNDMRLRHVSVGGLVYGSSDFKIEKAKYSMKTLDIAKAFDKDLAFLLAKRFGDDEEKAAEAAKVEEFFTILSITHEVLVQREEEGSMSYHGSSPDEVALVEASSLLGFRFHERDASTVTMQNTWKDENNSAKYKVLCTLEFSSARKRMSVVVEDSEGNVFLYMKGADAALIPRLQDPDSDVGKRVRSQLDEFSTKGLRTLIVAKRQLGMSEWRDWEARYQETASSLEDREEKMEAMAEEIETSLELVGGTAIEDRLQDGVPEAITGLLEAGINVWMITGDKQETAINIGISTGLLKDPSSLLICNASTGEGAREQLEHLLSRLNEEEMEHPELVIDGGTLSVVLGSASESRFVDLAVVCTSVIVCRASPLQKAAVVSLIKERTCKTCLAVGDGANDVGMIQVGDIGVGLYGREGRQAVNNADFAIGQFRFLNKLLVVHGHYFYGRLAHVIKYAFYKSGCFAYVLFYFQFSCGFSGQALFPSIPAAMYNVLFTFMPIFIVSLVDKDAEPDVILKYPGTYNAPASSLTAVTFWKAEIEAMVHALPVYLVTLLLFTWAGDSNDGNGLDTIGTAAFAALSLAVFVYLAIDVRSWTRLTFSTTAASFLFIFPFLWVYPIFYTDDKGITNDGTAYFLFRDPRFYMNMLLVSSLILWHRLTFRFIRWYWKPNDSLLLTEIEKVEAAKKNN